MGLGSAVFNCHERFSPEAVSHISPRWGTQIIGERMRFGPPPAAEGAGEATVQDILKGATREGGTIAEIYSKPGGVAQAMKDFNSLGGKRMAGHRSPFSLRAADTRRPQFVTTHESD